MRETATKRVKLSDRINAYVGSEAPLRAMAGNWSKTAKIAMDEANSLSLERVEIRLKRLPKSSTALRSFIFPTRITARLRASNT